jgi:phospholipase/carboxylesterase
MSHTRQLVTSGRSVKEADKALILIHGRGSSAENILSLADHLKTEGFALLAPQATGNTWYPLSFTSPKQQNEPWLTSALEILKEIEKELNQQGIASENIYFFGFSQGACLTLEYIARNAKKYGGTVAIIGGLIGEELDPNLYKGDFEETPVFIGTSDPDLHVPLERVQQTAKILEQKNARVKLKVYENAGHTILQEEIEIANDFVFSKI